jgi:Dolichyl-phosphate-mannose-protein mannosyltransferase
MTKERKARPQLTPTSLPNEYAAFFTQAHWWLFCLLVLAFNFFLLALDPLPKLFLGDSATYLHTALKGGGPADRSFLYGYVIRWSSVWTHSLTSLLILQAFLGAITAILIAVICRSIFGLGSRIAYFFGLLCLLDPLQVVWQRYVMTETMSLFFYVLMLLFSFLYLKERRLWQLALVQVMGVLVISFRMSYLLIVQISTIALPVLAFFPEIRLKLGTHRSNGTKISLLKPMGLHLTLSVVLMLALQDGYRHIAGRIAGREPALLPSSGLFLLATWAPAVKPTDSPDHRLAGLLAEGDNFNLNDLSARNAQLYAPAHLIDRWTHVEPNPTISTRVAKETALHALLHRPQSVARLGVMTFLGYWNFKEISGEANYELGGQLPKPVVFWLNADSRLAPSQLKADKTLTPLQKYFLRAQPYYYVVLLSPFLWSVLVFFGSKEYGFLLVLHSWILFSTVTVLAVTASVRYLQPMSLLTILLCAGAVKALTNRRSQQTLAAGP